jgi:4'-phosphopantetheinyl transferase
MRFNLSHSDDLMLLAVTFGREVGVDLEAIRDHVHYEMLAEHYFPPEDQWALRITPAPHRFRKFFELWTRTEARLKARGIGLSEDTPAPDLYDFTVCSVEPVAGYAAAIAVEGDAFDLTCLQWQN